MRYKVDWNNLNPAGGSTLISDGGYIADVVLDVHGDKVTVNASQLNGDIVLAADGRELQGYETGYGQPLKVKIVPEKGFVQYGFTLKYGYNVTASQQLDDNGNPNWIEVNVPYSEIAGDGTYTIPAEYMHGSQVSIKGDMQQEQLYTVKVVGLEGQGGVVYANIETPDGGTVYATQFFTAEQATAIAVEGYDGAVTLNGRVITVTYTLAAGPCREITSLTELKNYKLYQIKSKNNEGYLAWNTNITDTYLSLRGVTNFGSGNPNDDIRTQYAEEVNPFDKTVVWQIIQEDDKYYLYHPARGGYVTRDGRDYKFTEEKTALDGIRVNSGDHAGTFSFHAGGGYSDGSQNFACIVTNDSQVAVRNWTWDDHGAVMQIIENPNVYTLTYTVEVIGGGTEGGITFEGEDYAHGSTLKATEFLTAVDFTVKEIALSTAEVTIDKENAKISVAYGEKAPKADKVYTFSCFSEAAHSTTKFICDNGNVINGQSAAPSYFLFEAGDEAGTYYIKSAVSGKYINSDGNTVIASTTKSTAWKLGFPSHTPNAVTFGLSGDKYLNNNGTKSDGSCTNLQPHGGGPAAGNACSLWLLREYDPVYTITYSFKHDGVERFSQIAQVGKNEAYPEYNIQLPYGVVAATKPSGTITEDTQHDVVLTIEKELPMATASSIETITTWYYVKMHSNQQKYIQALNDNKIEWSDTEVAAGEEESHLWGFVGGLWEGIKLISKTGKAIVSTSGDAQLGDAANATAFIPMSSSTGVENGFCLKYPKSNYLNAQGGYVKTWNDNDPGSTILLEVYTPTGIKQMKASESVVIYDLMGRRVTQTTKGIYIINGKKVVIK